MGVLAKIRCARCRAEWQPRCVHPIRCPRCFRALDARVEIVALASQAVEGESLKRIGARVADVDRALKSRTRALKVRAKRLAKRAQKHP